MCDFDKISRLIIGAQAAYLVSLGIVAAAVILGSNPFTSGANIPAMVIASASAATAALLMAGAIAELDKCASGPCGPSVATLRTNLVALAASIGIFSVSLAALALVAGVPFAGSVAAGALAIWAVSLTSLFAAVASGYLGNAVQAFNSCLSASGSGNTGTTTVIVVLGVLTILLTVVFNAFGTASGVIPVKSILTIFG
ncbi:hypothetical protein DK847_00400 [Aestuariivirga litoralis]|uniref:Uncharacterized protein n=1 Tax=Aestuariivirga litoralis TaxID=2650924 RepID=A0A2W2AX45_9HYPH|nr:hypothetical protein [Aestuariivirga litoralis]PZF78322.1 hypothetical protein DK847_00400 [Aestuariivirga litoralis]